MMSCRDVTALSHDPVEGRLAWRQRAAVRLHLLMCVHCRRAFRQLRATLALLRRSRPEVEAPAQGEDALTAAFRQHHRDRGEPSG